MTNDVRPVEKWGMRSLVSDAMRADMGDDKVRSFLIDSCASKAEREGWTHLPGDESVEFISRDDPRWMMEEGRPPEGASLAFVKIKCFAPEGWVRPEDPNTEGA